jgi:DNA-binding IclR family transcriptional regulator
VAERGWTFLTNHAHVLVVVARDPEARLRDIADRVGITERSAHAIVHDLVEAGYLRRERIGRRNRYRLEEALPLRHPVERGTRVADLLASVVEPRA